MFRPQLIVRVDASAAIGAGHVMRCLAIAQAWQDADGDATFVCASLPEPLESRIRREGMFAVRLAAESGSMADAAQLRDIAESRNASAIVIDGYSYDVDYHRIVACTKSVSLAVDDNSHLTSYSTDYVLNQNAGFTPASYPNRNPRTELLLGTSYALLRREFLAASANPMSRPHGKRILVTLGGSDPNNITAKVVEGLHQLTESDIQVRAILGAVNPRVDSIRSIVAGDKRFEILQNIDDMSEQYRWADIAVAAGGSSNWEMCYFGLPRILLVIADNQIRIASELEQQQVAINLGNASMVKPHDVGKAVEQFLHAPERLAVARQMSLDQVDGRGACRCVERLLGHKKSPSRSRKAVGPQ